MKNSQQESTKYRFYQSLPILQFYNFTNLPILLIGVVFHKTLFFFFYNISLSLSSSILYAENMPFKN